MQKIFRFRLAGNLSVMETNLKITIPALVRALFLMSEVSARTGWTGFISAEARQDRTITFKLMTLKGILKR
jgi:hypothetical protein